MDRSVARERRSSRVRVAMMVGLAGLVALSGCSTMKSEKKSRASVPMTEAEKGVEALDAIDAFIAARPVDKSNPAWKTRVPRPPSVKFSPHRTYYWMLDTTEGTLKIELLTKYAPQHVTSTIYLTRLGFYDGLSFHRVIPQFMAQGGDPLGTGAGGPGYSYAGEFSKKATHDERGIVSMANSGPRTDGSQFFLLFKEQPNLDGKHTVFGKVVGGKGTIRSLEQLGSESGKPRKLVVIERAEIVSD